MRIFVASWFFPPSTSSEGIVSYKLLRNSRHLYDVCSSASSRWSYGQTLPLDAENITLLSVDTDDFAVWIEEAVRIFCERHAQEPYDAIMTRSMPPESVLCALRIKAAYPDIPWIASLADPIAKSPYHIKSWVIESEELSEQEKADFQVALTAGCKAWKNNPAEGIGLMCELKELEDEIIHGADSIIFPCDSLKSYVLGSRRRSRVFSLPHTFDRSLYPVRSTADTPSSQDPVMLTFLGHSDTVRSLEPFVRALDVLQRRDSRALSRLRIRFIGNVTEQVRTLVYNFYLYDHISIEPSVAYQTSLALMEESDWLLHVDAKFGFLDCAGKSIFFAGKLADYMGTDTPILALTGRYSPADEIVRNAGGLCFDPEDIEGIAEAFSHIAQGTLHPSVNREYRSGYDAVRVAADFDRIIEQSTGYADAPFTRDSWPVVHADADAEKFLSICVPAYNAEVYLDRCLFSLVSCKLAQLLDIIVVNDGSSDATHTIAWAYQQQYPGIVRCIDKQNGGHGSTINTALACAEGRYFRVVDSDDWLDSINLAKLMETILEQDFDADLVSTNYHQVYLDDGHTVHWTKISDVANYHVFDFGDEDFTMEYFTMASSMIKTELLRQAHVRLQEQSYYVDVEYILLPIPFVKTVMFTPEYLYRYAVGNAEQSINPELFIKRYDHHDRVIRRMVAYYEEMLPTMPEGQARYMRSLFVRHLLRSHYLLSLLWDPDKTRGCARAQEFDHFLKENAPELYRACGARYGAVKDARRSGFDPQKAQRFVSLEKGAHKRTAKRAMRAAARRIARTSLGKKLVKTQGARALKERLTG
ncbi:MAG: glycosyltransferase [Coriobacteriales bacterium]|jgi:glycosyltransferase involved in cell wall biosynthesis|nr:glycosyltransferase [Coriobacteriales bacterium]